MSYVSRTGVYFIISIWTLTKPLRLYSNDISQNGYLHELQKCIFVVFTAFFETFCRLYQYFGITKLTKNFPSRKNLCTSAAFITARWKWDSEHYLCQYSIITYSSIAELPFKTTQLMFTLHTPAFLCKIRSIRYISVSKLLGMFLATDFCTSAESICVMPFLNLSMILFVWFSAEIISLS